MSSFLTFVGLLAIFIFGKFIYDSFLTNNTNDNWDKYKKQYPVEASRVEGNTGLNISVKSKSREQDKIASLIRMASNNECKVGEVKKVFLDKLKSRNLIIKDIQEAIKMCKQNKYEESKVFKIDPDDTVSSFMEEWMTEYLACKEIIEQENVDIIKKMIANNSDIEKFIKLNENNDFINHIENDAEASDEFIHNLAYANEPAEGYRQKAISKMYDEKDYISAIHLLKKGLEFDEPLTEPFLYELLAECHENLSNYNEALFALNKAIDTLIKTYPNRFQKISEFYERRVEIHYIMDNDFEAYLDREKVEKYNAKYKSKKSNSVNDPYYKDVDDELPF